MESTCACVLGPWPWPRAFLSLASRVSVLGKAVLGLGLGFFCVLGLEPCVLDSNSDIKLGLTKQFVEALKPTSRAFRHIRQMFPSISEAKIIGGIFVGPQIRKMLASEELKEIMSDWERNAWQAFRIIVEGFLGNHRTDDFAVVVSNLIESYKKLGCRMSLKLHFLLFHLDFFQDNLGNVGKEHGERFHQDIQVMEKRNQGRWDEAIRGDYVWNLVRKCNTTYKQKIYSNVHF